MRVLEVLGEALIVAQSSMGWVPRAGSEVMYTNPDASFGFAFVKKFKMDYRCGMGVVRLARLQGPTIQEGAIVVGQD